MDENGDGLSFESFLEIYEKHVLPEFSGEALFSPRSLRRLYTKGRYKGHALHTGGRLCACAGLLHAQGVDSLLLDFLTVPRPLRGQGHGRRLMADLVEAHNASGLLVPCATPRSAHTAQQRHTRAATLRFFHNSGAEATSQTWQAAGTEYHLLWLPICQPLDEEAALEDLQAIYRACLPRAALWGLARSMGQ